MFELSLKSNIVKIVLYKIFTTRMLYKVRCTLIDIQQLVRFRSSYYISSINMS